jgi:hypothetical protein
MAPNPHGPTFPGSTHSHSVEYPEDSWNLYAMLDQSTTTALNVTQPTQAISIFKPYALRLQDDIVITSDADEEIIVIARFTSPVHIRKIMVIGGGEESQHPSLLKCYVNQETIDFSGIEAIRPAQVFNLPLNLNGTAELITAIQPFTNITTCAFFFSSNYGASNTVIKYIGLQGEHTHYRREAVDTVYEVLCNGTDIIQPEGSHSHSTHEHSHEHTHDHFH